MTAIPRNDPIIEILYGEKKILNSKYTQDQIEEEKIRAQKINELMRREIFDYKIPHFFCVRIIHHSHCA